VADPKHCPVTNIRYDIIYPEGATAEYYEFSQELKLENPADPNSQEVNYFRVQLKEEFTTQVGVYPYTIVATAS